MYVNVNVVIVVFQENAKFCVVNLFSLKLKPRHVCMGIYNTKKTIAIIIKLK